MTTTRKTSPTYAVPVPVRATATFTTVSQRVSNGLEGTRRDWRRQIMAMYPTITDAVIEPNGRVRAMHSNGKPFTLGFVNNVKEI